MERCLRTAFLASQALEKAEKKKKEQANAELNPQSFTSLPTADPDIEHQLIPLMIEAHLKSRPLGRLPPSKHWNARQKETWAAALTRECVRLNSALDDWENENDGLSFLNAVLRLITLPAKTIIPVSRLIPASGTYIIEQDDQTYTIDLEGPPPPSYAPDEENKAAPAGSTLTGRSKMTLNSYRKGRTQVGTRILFGHGSAERNEQTANIIERMHPDHGGGDPRILGGPPHPPLLISKTSLEKSLKRDAGKTQASPDVYGWSPDFFLSTRRRTGLMFPIKTFARLHKILAEDDIPQAIAFIFTAGGLTALNKIAEEENHVRRTQGLDPKLRPVNSGALFLKNVFKSALKTTSGHKSGRKLYPTQLGCGASGGMATLSLSSRAAHSKGKVIHTDDAMNAFNELKRKALILAASNIWPESRSLLNKYYGKRAPVFYTFFKDGERRLRVIWSTEGARMGCVIGSKTFCMAADWFIYRKLKQEFSKVTQLAATDDLVKFWDPPESDDPDEWERFYDHVAEYVSRYMELAKPIGIVLVPEKQRILIPEWAPLPQNPKRANGITLNVVKDGLVIAGAPVGTQAFIDQHADAKLRNINKRLDAIRNLSLLDPQTAVKILEHAGTNALDYYCSVVPPSLIDPLIRDFDDAISKTFLACISPLDEDANPACDPSRRSRALAIAELPHRCGGFGLIPLKIKAPAAFVTTLFAQGDKPVLRDLRDGLKDVASLAYHDVCRTLSPEGLDYLNDEDPAASVLPLTPDDLTSGPFAQEASASPSNLRARSVVVSIAMDLRRTTLRRTAKIGLDQNVLSDSDFIHIMQVTSRTQATRVTQASVVNPANRMPRPDFIAWARYFLQLPQLTPWQQDVVQVDGYDAAVCRMHADEDSKILDLYGNHAAACPSTFRSRSYTHTKFEQVVASYCKEVEMRVQLEPPTECVLAYEFDKKQCRHLFQRAPSAQTLENSSALFELYDEMQNPRTTQARIAELAKAADLLIRRIPTDANGLRLDVFASQPDGGGTSLLIDVAQSHDTKTSGRARMLQFASDLLANDERVLRGGQDDFDGVPSPAVSTTVKAKNSRYRLLTHIAKIQQVAGKRQDRVLFLACVMSHTGEMAPDVLKLITLLAQKSMPLANRPDCLSGLTPTQTASDFRMRMKDTLAVSMARGWGMQLRCAGFCDWKNRNAGRGRC
jgi:hypothetical protein